MNQSRDLSFMPGAGIPPPFLAGRDDEKAAISMALDRLSKGLNPSQNIALIGPRGNGKTVLLRWVAKEIDRRNGNIECKALLPDDFDSHRSLVRALKRTDQSVLQSFISRIVSANLSAKTPAGELEIGVSRRETADKRIRTVLEKECSRNGLAILIDEAHTLNRYQDLVRAFFNTVQTLSGYGKPLLLILAGTPNITPRLNEIEASFWDRLKKIGVELLGAEAARNALQIPLEQMGFSIEAGILDKAAEEAQCYPYFLQVVGEALHEAAKVEPGNRVGGAILERALEELQIRKNNYYSGRYRELRRAGLRPAAEAVARLFVSEKKKSISNGALEVAVEQSLDGKMEELAKSKDWNEPAAWFEAELRDFGFVWSRIGHERLCEPGIPSLMDYIIEMAQEREKARVEANS